MNATETVTITVCTDCAVIIANGDSSIDGGEEKADALDAMGGHFVIDEVTEGDSHLFRCGGCGDDVMSDVVTVEWTRVAG